MAGGPPPPQLATGARLRTRRSAPFAGWDAHRATGGPPVTPGLVTRHTHEDRPSARGRAKGETRMPKRPPTTFLLCFAAVALSGLVVAACGGGFAPVGPPAATDIGALGCEVGPLPGATIRTGYPLGPGEPMAGVPVTTMTPRQVGEAARARGLKVTWRYEYGLTGNASSGYSECWCEPPPAGRVTDVLYGGASELIVFVDAGVTYPAPRAQPPRGWGCQ